MRTLERKKILSDLWDLFLIYKEFRICQEFFIVLLTSFFSLLVAWGPLVSCPWVLRIYSYVVCFISGSHFISVPLGNTKEGSRLGLPWREYFIRSSQTESWRRAFLVLIVGFLWLLDPGSEESGFWACFWATVFPALRHAWFFPRVTLEFFDEDKRTCTCCQKLNGGEIWLLLPKRRLILALVWII